MQPQLIKGMWLMPVAPPMRSNTLYLKWHPYGLRSKVCFWLARRLLRGISVEVEPDKFVGVYTVSNNEMASAFKIVVIGGGGYGQDSGTDKDKTPT